MGRFLKKITLFIILLVSVLGLSLMLIPYKKLGTSTFLFSILDKHRLLRSVASPKLILVGGSNLGFGLDSERISQEFQVRTVNMGIHGGLGLRYMLNDVIPFVHSGDIVVIVPEYDQFVRKGRCSDGQQELLCTLFDIYPEGRAHVSLRQWTHLARFLPTYAASKLVLYLKESAVGVLHGRTQSSSDIYDRRAFNDYGDVVAHWQRARIPFPPHAIKGTIDTDVVAFLNSFACLLESKGVHTYLLYPCFESTSFGLSHNFVELLDQKLHGSLVFPILSPPDRYMLRDDLFYDTPYHLNKAGVGIRTGKVIEDLTPILKKSP